MKNNIPTQIPASPEVKQPFAITPQKSNWFLISFLILFFLSISISIVYLAYQNLRLRKQIASSQITQTAPSPAGGSLTPPISSLFPESEDLTQETNVSPNPSPTSVQIPILSTADWKTVSQNGISFKIPTFASCDSNANCTHVSYNGRDDNPPGQAIPYDIYVSVNNYDGGSRREYFLAKNTEVRDCRPIYVESLFGRVRTLQIAVDGEFCQGSSGGIVATIANKIIIFSNGLSYISENKYIGRWPIRDTVISTLFAH